jgi:hypothetical protein
MSSVVLDSQVLERLQQTGGRVEIRNAAGQVVGYFTPSLAPSLYDSLESPVGEDELRRRAQKGGGRTLEEILRDLERRA